MPWSGLEDSSSTQSPGEASIAEAAGDGGLGPKADVQIADGKFVDRATGQLEVMNGTNVIMKGK